MKRFTIKMSVAVAMLVMVSLAAVAVEEGQVAYVGGTLSNPKAGTIGRLDTTQETSLAFEHPGGKLTIPYSSIESFQYTEQRARRLGVLPTIAIGLFKHLQRQHFFRISYRDDANVPQAIVFEVSKQMPQSLNAVLAARVPKHPRSAEYSGCGN